eukprot:CAMPEP_0183376820 /NCGR_PEP_ID=MMETSP0164_2-20130417/121395_1 /TAXON_ID=221442 /ORGANISM="Coccolithus pelagicus ssp braarudi, Strain PLY182g" /LENGTH=66 /DNA_ID=CAMNT_0025554205 /DNA_START=20 /DNA_END=217 /DNA_ORIENTATION=-
MGSSVESVACSRGGLEQGSDSSTTYAGGDDGDAERKRIAMVRCGKQHEGVCVRRAIVRVLDDGQAA